MKKKLLVLALLSILTGCSSWIQPKQPSIEPVVAPATKAPAQNNASDLNTETLYSLLTAEIAGLRSQFHVALDNYTSEASKTQNAQIAERAFNIADSLGEEQNALDNALLWAQLAPNDVKAQRAAAIYLARTGRLDDAMERMEFVLRNEGETNFDFLALSAAQTSSKTRQYLLKNFDALLVRHPQNLQIIFAKALLLEQEGDNKAAYSILRRHPQSTTTNATALMLARLLLKLERTAESLPILRKAIDANPEDSQLRMLYARVLIESNQLETARTAFLELLLLNPENDDLRLSLALINMDMEAWQEAKTYLEDLINRESLTDSAHYYLGRTHEELQDTEQALISYDLVRDGANYLPAQYRYAEILLQQKQFDQVSLHFARERRSHPNDAVDLYLIEIEGLNRQGETERAWQLTNQGIDETLDQKLYYTRAMLADTRKDLKQLEADLRHILEKEPENSMALNALGYSLLDIEGRLEEAGQLIIKAHDLDPEDAATLDSLGWYYYKTNQLSKAEEYLRQAFAAYPDAEVAAHLGEALWALNKKREAKRIWAQALKTQPDNKLLQDTMQRLLETKESK